MKKNKTILSISLFAGAFYFLAVATVHMLGIKLPMLFIYFNVPSYAYQDRIISFLAFVWGIFLFTAARDVVKNVQLVKAILIAGGGAIIGLGIINATADFHALDPAINVAIFWMETAVLLLYVLWLIVFYARSKIDH